LRLRKSLRDFHRLGKTLQSITLLWTLLKQGFDGKPMAKRVVIITPTSLVSNWEQEITKWLSHRTVNVLAMCESTRADVLQGISTFLSPQNFYQVSPTFVLLFRETVHHEIASLYHTE
jgi:DNA repair and recombination RAD54-like protein